MITDVKLHKPEHFDRRFEKYYRESETYIEAYKKTESDYKAVFGERKYSSYNSFRNAYNTRQRTNEYD